jgi:hypothetical protein
MEFLLLQDISVYLLMIFCGFAVMTVFAVFCLMTSGARYMVDNFGGIVRRAEYATLAISIRDFSAMTHTYELDKKLLTSKFAHMTMRVNFDK